MKNKFKLHRSYSSRRQKALVATGMAVLLGFTSFTVRVHAGDLYWDVNGSAAGSGNQGGVWDEGENWSTAFTGDEATVEWQDGENAVFSAGGDGVGAWTVTIYDEVSTPLIEFRQAGNKTISGGVIHIGGGTINAMQAGNTTSLTIASELAGTGGLILYANGNTDDSGGGQGGNLSLTSGTNTISGDITIRSGVVRADSDFGDPANKLVLAGGGLVDGGWNLDFTRNIEVPEGRTGVYRTYGSVTGARLSGKITGSGTLKRTDGGSAAVLVLDSDASGFSGMMENAMGNMVIGENSTTWGNTTFVQRENDNILHVTNPGDTLIKGMISDRDVIIPAGSRLNLVSGVWTTEEVGATFNPFRIRGATAGDVSTAGVLTSSSGILDFTNGPEAGMVDASPNQYLEVVLADPDATTPLQFVKSGFSQLRMPVANSHTGGTTVNGGRLNASDPGAFGTGTVTVNDGGQAWLNTAGTFTNPFVIDGLGASENAGQLGAIRFASGSILSGALEVAGHSRISSYTSSASLSGPLSGSGDLEIGVPGSAGTLTFTGDLSAYRGALIVNQANTLNLVSSGGGLEVDGGTANVSGAVDGPVAMGSGTLNLLSGGSIKSPELSGGVLNILSGAQVKGGLETVMPTVVRLAGAVEGGMTLAGGDELFLQGGTVAGGLRLDSGALLQLEEPVAVTGQLTVTGEQTVDLINIPEPGDAAVVFSYSGNFIGNIGSFVMENASSYRNAVFTNDTANKVVKVSLGNQELTWTGAESVEINDSEANWESSGAPALLHAGDVLIFDDSSAATDLTLAGLYSIGGLRFAHDGDYVLAGGDGVGFSGSGGLVKTGAGTLTLGGGAGSYSGPVTVQAGGLVLGARYALGVNGAEPKTVTVADGAWLDFNNQVPTTPLYSFVVAGDGGDGRGAVVNRGSSVIASNARILNFEMAGDTTVGGAGRFDIGYASGSGVITGNGYTLTKVGSNQIQMRGDASGSPINIVVNEGVLGLENHDNAFGGADGLVTVNGGAAAAYGVRTIATPVVLHEGTALRNLGGGDQTWTGDITLAGPAAFEADSGQIHVQGKVTGEGPLSKDGGYSTFLYNDNDYSGGTVIKRDRVVVRGDKALGEGPVIIGAEDRGGVEISLRLEGVTIDNDIEGHYIYTGDYMGTLTATGGVVSTVNGTVTMYPTLGSANRGGHLGATAGSTLVLNGPLEAGGGQGTVVHRNGTVVYSGGGSSAYTLNLGEGQGVLGADNGMAPGAKLNFSGSADSALDMGGFSQTLSGLLFTAENGARSFPVTGGGALTINAVDDTQFGPGGTLSAARNFTADFSGIDSFTWNGPANIFRVGLRSGSTNNYTGNTGTFTVALADENVITASSLRVGDISASNHGGLSALLLGESNVLNADTINVGASGRSNAMVTFRGDLEDPSVVIRAADGVSPVSQWDIGRIANFTNNAWTATIDFTAGSVDAKVNRMRVAIADPHNQTNRQGTQSSFFSMGAGVLEAGELIIGDLSGATGASAATFGAAGVFVLDSPDGLVRVNELVLANNTGGVEGGTRNVSGAFNLYEGTLEAGSINRGPQDGKASNVTAALNLYDGTLTHLDGADLVITDVPLNLSGTEAVIVAQAGRSITATGSSRLGGFSDLVKRGGGTLMLGEDNLHSGTVYVEEGVFGGGGAPYCHIVVPSGATLAPGAGVGVMEAASVDLEAGSTVAFEINGASNTADTLVVTDSIDLSGVAASFASVGGGIVPAGTVLTIVDTNGAGVTGAFNGLAEGAAVAAGVNTFTISYSGGNVTLTSTSVGNAYTNWAAAMGLDDSPGKDSAYDADPDGDGLANVLEWILGGDPLAVDSAGLVGVEADGGDGLTLRFTREPSSVSLARLFVEFDADLAAPWAGQAEVAAAGSGPDANGVVISIVPTGGAGGDDVTVRIPASNAVGGRLFARLRAEAP